jgi:hypothetical protein
MDGVNQARAMFQRMPIRRQVGAEKAVPAAGANARNQVRAAAGGSPGAGVVPATSRRLYLGASNRCQSKPALVYSNAAAILKNAMAAFLLTHRRRTRIWK